VSDTVAKCLPRNRAASLCLRNRRLAEDGQVHARNVDSALEENRLFSDQYDCTVIFSWHIADELAPKVRSKGYRDKLVTSLPVPRK
jgi:hypothetical protein